MLSLANIPISVIITKLFLPDEPNSADSNDSRGDLEDYVIASGSKGWSDAENNWTAVIGQNMEPTGYVCETGKCSIEDIH